MRFLPTMRAMRVWLSCLVTGVCFAVACPPAQAQAFVMPADPELRAVFQALLDERRPLIDRITPDEAAGVLDELHELYVSAVELSPGLGGVLARDLSRAYDAIGDADQGREWMSLSSELTQQEPSIRGMRDDQIDREQSAARTEINASMRRAQSLQASGELQAAVDEFAYASSLLAAAPPDTLQPSVSYQLEFQRAMLLDKLGRDDDAFDSFVGEHIPLPVDQGKYVFLSLLMIPLGWIFCCILPNDKSIKVPNVFPVLPFETVAF